MFGYERERGRFKLFRARAVVLATGGIGRAYKITSNSWEGTGDGHSLAYHAGAELIDMEFVQFHPTGMIWPPSVQGILVTEGVRGEGGILLQQARAAASCSTTSPRTTAARPPTTRKKAGATRRATRTARRPPELLTRDHVARCIVREVKEGRGSPHGGVFLDIAWIKKRLPNAEEHIKRKLPSMYHQFKQLADIDITKEPMEVGPTTHYVMGGVRVDADTQMSTVPGLFAAGECAAGINGANRLGGNSLSDLLVFGKRAGRIRGAVRAREHGRAGVDDAQVDARRAGGARAVRARTATENPYPIQHDLQEHDAGPRRHRPARETRCSEALGGARTAEAARAAAVAVTAIASTTPAGTPRSTSATCSPSPRRSRARRSSARKAAAGIFATIIQTRIAGVRQDQHRGGEGRRRFDGTAARTDPRDASRVEAGDRGPEQIENSNPQRPTSKSSWELGVGSWELGGLCLAGQCTAGIARRLAGTIGVRRGEQRDEQIGGIEAALIGGAQHAGEDLLTVRAAGGAIAAAAHLAGDDGGAQGLFGAPVGGVERRVEEKAEDGVEFDDEVLLKASHPEPPTGRALQQAAEALEVVAARDGEPVRRDVAGAIARRASRARPAGSL